MEYTFTMIKPDISSDNNKVLDIEFELERQGFKIIDKKEIYMDMDLASRFYAEHKGKDFYNPLIEFMISGISIAYICEKDNAIKDLRKLLGNTDPTKSTHGTLRYKYGTSTRNNALHGSDSKESVSREIKVIFGD